MGKYFPKMMGQKVYLSPMFLDYAELYTKWMNDFEVTKYLGQAAKCISLESENKHLEKMVAEGHNYAIILKEDDRLLGNISLFDINQMYQRAEIGLFIGEKTDRCKGYGTEALKLLTEYGFKYLNLINIMLKVYAGNNIAINTYLKCGFKEFGRRTKCLFVDGQWQDEIFMEVLRNDFLK